MHCASVTIDVTMSYSNQLHVLDIDSRRRAQIAFTFADFGLRPQVYEDLYEFEKSGPRSGAVLVNAESGENWLEAVREHFEARGQYLPIAMYPSNPSTEEVVSAMLAGAVDYLEWPFEPESVCAALKRMAVRSAHIARVELKRADARRKIDKLSSRERDVLVRLIDGFSNRATAQDLGISARTVEIHRANVIRKLDVASSVEAVRVGLYAGLDIS